MLKVIAFLSEIVAPMKLTFEPPFLPQQTAAIAILLIGAAVALAYAEIRLRTRRYLPLLCLRLAVVLSLAVILFNPTVSRSVLQPGEKPVFHILLDTSRSMTTPDAADTSRWQFAKRVTLENRLFLDALRARYDVRFHGFDSRLAALDSSTPTVPNGSRTDIGNALTQTVSTNAALLPDSQSSAPVRGGILLVSDGRDNGEGLPLDAARTARTAGYPVYTLCVGQETQARDIQVAATNPQRFAAPRQSIEIGAEIRNVGMSGITVTVDLLREGKKIAARQITLTSGSQEVTFPVTEPRKGFYRYAVACSAAPGETDPTNNRANIFLNVLDSRARVLLLEGSPTWDAKFLAQALREDPTIMLDSVFQLTETRPFALSGDPNVPELHVPHTLAEFTHYDVIVLGKGYETFFDDAATTILKQWVSERGGSLILLRGRPDEHTAALRELEPVRFGDAELDAERLRLTEAGRAYPGFTFHADEDAQTVVQKLPTLISAAQVTGEKALAVVLARMPLTNGATSDSDAPEMATLAYQRFGQGKVMAVVGQGIWRWAFPPPDEAEASHVYADFWTQTVRWMVSESDFLPGQNVALHADKSAYGAHEAVTLLGYLRGAKPETSPTITVTQPDGSRVNLVSSAGSGTSADFVAVFRPTLPGEYAATILPPANDARAAPAVAAFTVYPGQEEDANRSANPVLMRQIAASGGGQALQAADLPALPEKLRALALEANRTEVPETAWDRGYILALLIGLLTAEWLLRRR